LGESVSNTSPEKVAQTVYEIRRYMNTVALAKEITDAIKTCNLLFCSLTHIPTLFREDIQAISALHQPYNDENAFQTKIGALAGLFQVDSKPWNALFTELDPKIQRANTLLLKWLDEKHIPYDPDKAQIWEDIQVLRNASFPYHQTDQRWIALAKRFGQNFPINYADFYEVILRKFLDSLKMLQTILNGISSLP
jgi:hypothetical protein